ncbi:MAG TPA: autotransporter-associated beta strand repeat-containing protein [Candidatus Paceibacterota bacterium]|nr:autotransporter-associated beta strand repeat-containing protein [Verrucomicrobiota bacterium]HRZ44939.1 autotransporter-associated beta strand repeat-containing protein [Candidatus Paceibacterota bacterium]
MKSMNFLRAIGVCALAAASLATSSFGQLEIAGTLQVDVDATAAPVGPYTFLANQGAMGGVFVVTNQNPGNNTSVGPQIIATGGTGTRGALLDGNSFLQHYTDEASYTPVLPPFSMAGANPVFSVEVWAAKSTILSEYAAVSWGTRSTGLEVSCNWGYHGTWGGFSFYGGGCDYAWARVPAPGAWRHLAWTYDGAGTLKLYRDGVLDSIKNHTAALNVDGNYNILIGAQHNAAAFFGLFAGVIGKVRIHDGVLTDAQVAQNYALEASSFVIPADPVLASGPLHRYSFNLPATANALGMIVPDTGSAGNAPALIQGLDVPGALPAFDGDHLILTSYGSQSYMTNSYVDLPNGLLSSLSANNGGPGQVTFELWATYRAANNWVELLYFGSSTIGEIAGPGSSAAYDGANGIVLPAQIGSNQDQSGVRGAVGNKTISARLIGARKHIVLTWDESSDTIKLYHEGIQVGQFNAGAKMSAIVDVNNWLGRSGWRDANAQASYREFRIYSRVLSGSEVRRNYLVGPLDASDATTLAWSGAVNGSWDAATANWLLGAAPATFADGASVLFGDNATGSTSVNIAAAVAPAATLAVHSAKDYTFSGTGKITGPGGLTKAGSGTLTLGGALANDFTGPTVLAGGKLAVSSLASGGIPSPIGASSANPTNLVFAGGTLSFQGPPATIDRGYFTTHTNSAIEVQNALTLTGPVAASTSGTMTKTGPGTLIYAGSGSNSLSGGVFPGYVVARGTVVFDGTAGGQTNRNMSEFFVGGTPDYGGHAVISNATLISDSYFSVGRGNGAVGNTSSLTLHNGNLLISANGLALGYSSGLPNLSSQTLTLNGASTIYMPGFMYLGESAGSSATAFLNGTSWIRTTRLLLGLASGATGALYMADSAVITNSGGYTSIGQGAGSTTAAGGIGSMVIKDNAAYYSTGDFNVSDLAFSIGQLDIQDNATVTGGTTFIGKAAGSIGVLNMSGGSFTAPGANVQIGQYGEGTVNLSGGVFTAGNWPSIGRYSSGIGALNVSAGTFAQTNATTDLIVGEEGNGTLTVSGTGLVKLEGRLRLGNSPTAVSAVNLDGGTIVTRQVWTAAPGGASSFIFNGGTLVAGPDASSDFMSGISGAYLGAGGIRIDTAGNDIAIVQDIWDMGGGGGLTKLGAGTLTLSGYAAYTGPTIVSQGALITTTRGGGMGDITMADATELSVAVQDALNEDINPVNLTVGGAAGATITIGLGSFGNPSIAPINVGGTFTANGIVILNVEPSSAVGVGEIPLISYDTLGGSGTVVLGDLPPGVFGYLTNNTAAMPKHIGIVVTSVKLPRWEGLAGGTWDVEATTNWIDQASLLPDYFYQSSSVLFDDQALGTTSVNLVTNVAPGTIVVDNSTRDYSFNGVGRITGTSSLVKRGTASLTINTTNNSYSGKTLIDGGGTLIATVPNSLGANSALVLSNASTLSLGANAQKFGSVTVASGTISGPTTITASSFHLDQGVVEPMLDGGTLSTFGPNTDQVSVFGANTYTGRTFLAGSTLLATNLANGGQPSSVGASSSSPTNLVFAGGGLSYAGPAAATDRGYAVAGGGTLSVSSDLTLHGEITATTGLFAKSGPSTLAYAHLGTNVLSGGGYRVGQGTVILDGGAGAPGSYLQTNRINGELWIGYDQVNAGTMILTNTSLGVSSWLAIDRGNGTVGSSSRLELHNSVMTVGNFSMGYANNIEGNSSFPVLTLSGDSSLTSGGQCMLGESVGAEATIRLTDNSRITLNGGWFALGNSGKATMVLSNQATVRTPGDYNLGDVQYGDGTLSMYDNATNLCLTLFVGKGANSMGVVNQFGGYMGKSAAGGADWRIANNASAVGVYNLRAGMFETPNNFQIGAFGDGTWSQSGGIANCGSYPVVGRYEGGIGTMTVSGGTFNQTGGGQLLIIGEQGTGTMTVTNTGTVTSAGGISIGHTTTGIGTVNLDGGTLAAPRIYQAGGEGASSTFNFNGGVLAANADNASFMAGLGAANVLAGGAVIDTASYGITIAQPLLDGGGNGGLIKLGVGTLTLAGNNTYTGPTIVQDGALVVNGLLPGAAIVRSGAILGGNGVVNGVVTVEAGGAIGAGTSIGTLTLNSSPVLNGTVVAEIDRNGGSPQADLITVSGYPIAYGGTLAVTNTGADLEVNDTFHLFNASGYSGSFTLLSLTPDQIVTWDTSNLAVNGTIRVSATSPAIPTTPTDLEFSVSSGQINLSWPEAYTGWRLESQTNALSVGITTQWFTVPGSTATNQIRFQIDTNNAAVFYRLVYP